MASKGLLMMMIMVGVAFAPALGVDYMVGDANGWKLDVNYTEWAAGKQFYVGDTLTFMYTQDHNILKVTGVDFKACNTSNALGGPYTSGNDKFTLATPGKKWYICGVGDHCARNMKLVIYVDGTAPAPAPASRAPAASAAGSFSLDCLCCNDCFFDDHSLTTGVKNF